MSSNRTDRSVPRKNARNERKYRDRRISNGRRLIRRRHYSVRPGDIVEYDGQMYTVIGVQSKGAYISVYGRTPIPTAKAKIVRHVGGWGKPVD